jgi:hypothetical protein
MRESKAKLLDLLRQNVLLSEAVVNTANNDAASWPIHLCSVLRHMPVTHTCACVCDGVCVRVCVCICASVPVPERRILPPQLLHFRRHALHHACHNEKCHSSHVTRHTSHVTLQRVFHLHLRCIRADHLLHHSVRT